MSRFLISFFLVAYFFLFTNTNSQAGIWLRPTKVTQGEVILVSGLFVSEQDSQVYLKDCSLEFANKEYQFFLDILDYESFEDLDNQAGFQFVSRIPTDVFSKTGLNQIKLKCPNKLERTYQVEIESGEFPLQSITLTGGKASLRTTAQAWQEIKKALATKTDQRLWDPGKTWSLPNDSRISTIYGVRRKYNGVFAKNYFHKGIDFAGNYGEPIKAPSSGIVVLVGPEKEGFYTQGNCVFIDHGQGLVSAYYHLSKIKVKAGEFVYQDQVIGEIGSTGMSTGPHLHFGLYSQGVNINPDYLFKESFF